MTNTYLRWLLLFSPAFLLNDILLCFLRNDDSPQLPMAAMLAGSFANILLDYIFIFPLGMGMFGAIFATGLSPVISILLMLPHWLRKKNTFHIIKAGPDPILFRQNVSLGFPSLIAQVSSGMVMITFNGILLSLAGNTGVAAYGVIANLSLVIVAIYTGIAQGIQPLLSSFYAVGNQKQVQRVMRYAMTTMFVLSWSIYLFLFVFADPIAAVFNSEGEAELQRIAVRGLKLYFTSNVFAGYNIILAIFFPSVEKVLPAQLLSLLRGFVLIIPLALLLSFWGGMTGVWLAYPLTEFLTAILGFIIYQHYK